MFLILTGGSRSRTSRNFSDYWLTLLYERRVRGEWGQGQPVTVEIDGRMHTNRGSGALTVLTWANETQGILDLERSNAKILIEAVENAQYLAFKAV